MHQEHEQLDRRGFLRLSGAGAAIAGTKILFPSLFHLHRLNIESFDREGDRVTIGLERNSHIVLDWASKSYSIVLDGVEVARNDSTFCPVDNDKIACYALAPQTLTATLPAGWKAEEMAAVTLSTDKRIPVYFHVDRNQVRVAANAQQPILIYRKKEAARLG